MGHNQTEFTYRLIYESLSRFSTVLSRSATTEDIRLCLQKQLKYLFDYPLIRFSYYQESQLIVYSVLNNSCHLEWGEDPELEDYEQLLKSNSIPISIAGKENIQKYLVRSDYPLKKDLTGLWGWNFVFADGSGVLVSIFTEDTKKFQLSDIPVLKITVENLYAKIFNISLMQELDNRKHELESALDLLNNRNKEIGQMVSMQESIIIDRTRKLSNKNNMLIKLSRMNSHNIREPLSRILGLAYLVDLLSTEEIKEEIIPSLVKSAQDLDRAIKEGIELIEKEIN